MGTESNTVAIVIPLYKYAISEYEILSIKRCLDVLGRYPIFFVVPNGFSLKNLEHKILNLSEYNAIYFDKRFFSDIAGYNELMKSKAFYESFLRYQYILIYQTDCYVFRDDLLYWCQRGYDYIGAPWFTNFTDPQNTNLLENVGNGGFSLRKVKSFIKILRKSKIKSLYSLFKEERNSKGLFYIIRNYDKLLARFYSEKNSFQNYLNSYKRNEDAFWAIELDKLGCGLSKPTPQEALNFSFDYHPECMYQLNNNALPFGVHAWHREDTIYTGNRAFWRKHISELSSYE